MKRAIIVMAKVPVAGAVKTRLGSVLPPEKCAELAAAFLRDTLKKSETVCKNIILAYASAGGKNFPEEIVSPEIVLIEQAGDDLGARMANAFEYAFRENSIVLMIGTDSPTFPASYLAEAFAALENDSEIVLGKAADGGFYLIGLRRNLAPGIFENIEWSSARVFARILKNIERAKIEKLNLIPEHYDVDTPEDFARLQKEVSGNENLRKTASETYRWLKENDLAI